ncbi:MAG: hypothetical protein H6566_25780 [Lewinellaceae bacterium]|nr:hypothetical protein [Lewinellaceae bacterium]
MDKVTKNNILIIGGPNTGKTHFGAQLYGRLNSRQFEFKIDPKYRPFDLTIFENALNNLYDGKRAAHTEAGANRSIELKVTNESGQEVVFTFPDYAGEQITSIVENRIVNNTWQSYIQKSTSWVLFIRLKELTPVEDIINKGIPSPEEIQKRKSQTPPIKISDVAFFTELLQTLVYVKGLSTFNKIDTPNLTVMLSCWDELNQPNDTVPSELLKQRLPMLFYFLVNNWQKNSLSVLGLSSTEKSLTDDPDDEYIDKTPINFGYVINKNGKRENDLTLSIYDFLGYE